MMTAMTVIVVMVAAMTVMMRVDIGVGSVEEDPMVVGGVFQVDVAVHLGIEVTLCLLNGVTAYLDSQLEIAHQRLGNGELVVEQVVVDALGKAFGKKTDGGFVVEVVEFDGQLAEKVDSTVGNMVGHRHDAEIVGGLAVVGNHVEIALALIGEKHHLVVAHGSVVPTFGLEEGDEIGRELIHIFIK